MQTFKRLMPVDAGSSVILACGDDTQASSPTRSASTERVSFWSPQSCYRPLRTAQNGRKRSGTGQAEYHYGPARGCMVRARWVAKLRNDSLTDCGRVTLKPWSVCESVGMNPKLLPNRRGDARSLGGCVSPCDEQNRINSQVGNQKMKTDRETRRRKNRNQWKVRGQRLQELGLTYQQYLNSEHWSKTRQRFYRSGLWEGHCHCCLAESPCELHHRTYARLGEERLNDLIAVCPGCHDKVHDLISSGMVFFKRATKRLRKIVTRKRERIGGPGRKAKALARKNRRNVDLTAIIGDNSEGLNSLDMSKICGL